MVLLGTGRWVQEQERQVSNWIKSGGRVPHPCTGNNIRDITGRNHTGRYRGGRLKASLAVGFALLISPLVSHHGHARDPDGRYANSPLKQWFDGLRSGKGPCCSDADGSAVSDVDWEFEGRALSRAAGRRVARRAGGCGHHRAQSCRPNHGVADTRIWRIDHPLLHAGQHELAAAIIRVPPHAYFLSRSRSSIEIPCGPRMKQMRTPGRMVVGSRVNSTPLALISAATASMSFTASPK